MKLRCLPAVLFAPFAALAADPRGDTPGTPPSTPQEQLAKFHVPPGFEVQLVAAEPEIQKPINLNFDGAGRLWVTGSELYPWPAGKDANGQAIENFQQGWQGIVDNFRVGEAPQPPAEGRDSVRVLGDFDATGHARKITVFADKLNIPSGIQPLPRKPGGWNLEQAKIKAEKKKDGSWVEDLKNPPKPVDEKATPKGETAIVYSIPNIWLMADVDGDGFAEKREPLYTGFGYTDTHGGSSSYIYWIDGWIYGTHGFRNHSEVRDLLGHVTVIDSGNTYRFRPDGTAFEIYTHGQTNPFGLTFDPLGNLYSADSHSKPVYMLVRGGYYEGIGKQHDGLGFAPRITDDDHGSSSIAGISYYADDKWPEEYRGNLFNGNPVTQRINRDRLEWHGSTPKAIRMPDFLTCDDPWFRPVNLKLGPDGALYIADFYNPIIGHYEVPLTHPARDHAHGRIWRVVWRGESAKSETTMPDLTKLDAAGLVDQLNDPSLEVRRLATNELSDRNGTGVIPMLHHYVGHYDEKKQYTEIQNTLSDWAIRRIERETYDAIMGLPKESFSDYKLHPLQIKLYGDLIRPGAGSPPLTSGIGYSPYDLLSKALTKDTEQRRAAVESLLNDPSDERIEQLVRVIKEADAEDTELTYSARATLRDLLKQPALTSKSDITKLFKGEDLSSISSLPALFNERGVSYLFSEPPGEKAYNVPEPISKVIFEFLKRTDQLDEKGQSKRGGLRLAEPLVITNRLAREDPAAAEILANIWLAVPSPEAGAFLLSHLERTQFATPRAGEYLKHAAANLPVEKVRGAIDLVMKVTDAPLSQRLELGDAVTQAARQRKIELPENLTAWSQRAMIEALESGDEALQKRGVEAVRDVKLEAKLDPLTRIARDEKRDGKLRQSALEAAANLPESRGLFLLCFDDQRNMSVRKRAAELLAQNGESEILLRALPQAPWELALGIAGALAKTDAGAAALLEAIEGGKAPARVLVNRAVVGGFFARPKGLQERAKGLAKDLPPEDARLDKVIAERAQLFRTKAANADNGSVVFQKNCAVCHRFRNVSQGNVGPNLDGVAARGAQRLIEDILDPNRNVDPGFRQTIIETNDGQMFAGANVREQDEAVLMTDATGKEVSVAKASIKTRVQSPLSLMPPAFETVMAEGDLNDLIGYLLGPGK